MMNYVRFRREGQVNYGILKEDKVSLIKGDVYGDYSIVDKVYDLTEVDLLPPCQPSKIVCVGLNYLDHAQELGMEIPKKPIIFLKPTSALVGPEDKIKHPRMSQQVDYEAELAIVIKERTKDVSSEEAKEHILGYTCFNDVTARDLQAEDGQWTRAKSFDTFAPVGPSIVSDIEGNNLKIELLKNGEVKQDSNTDQMIFTVEEIVSFVSQIMTLEAGDLITTGTPPGVGPVEKGDEVVVEIEKVGSLKNIII
ncbi:fumarylacetoacetate hydrolase family protein [Natroniella acetigena]|uniref:fumarylacetoacetate hydrolase family protein n=1 Tax=Natroniella acetigena TaxID=52004 RepID=UPI00200B2669|nr:fumarylacetoacetate hydrolase family protein [Natroniella acetigena]MCK8826192.1 fumarylacetoacetate hydrolase family protein [Natroniella acetigena]